MKGYQNVWKLKSTTLIRTSLLAYKRYLLFQKVILPTILLMKGLQSFSLSFFEQRGTLRYLNGRTLSSKSKVSSNFLFFSLQIPNKKMLLLIRFAWKPD